VGTNFKTRPQLEAMDERVVPSGLGGVHHLGAVHPQIVDISGEVMRQNDPAPSEGPHGHGHAGRRGGGASFVGAGQVAEMGRVSAVGTVSASRGRGGAGFRGNLTLTGSNGSVHLTFNPSSYRITGGTGAYRGASGVGVVTFGTLGGPQVIGIDFLNNHAIS
jgi:hypothetical protein